MAKEAKKKTPQFITPKGVFKFPRLREPDTKYKPEGEYSTKLVLDGEAAKELIEKLQPLHDEAVEKGKEEYDALPVKTRKQNEFKVVDFFSPVYDEDTEEETGEFEFSFKMKASGVNKKTGKKWNRKPALFDAKGKPLPASVNPWGGTIGKVSFQVMPFFTAGVGAGLSLRLEAAQVIELNSGGAKSAKGYGFGEEDGYEAPEDDEDEDEEDDNEEGEGADAEDPEDF